MDNIVRASEIDSWEQEFLWNGRLPVGEMCVVAGNPRIGKSFLGYHIAAACDVPTLFISTEESDKTIWHPRLRAAGVDPMKAMHSRFVFTTETAAYEWLIDTIRENGIKLIVVDPAQDHIDASLAHDRAVRRLMTPYLDAFVEMRVALLVEAHVLRTIQKGSDPQMAIPSGLRGRTKAAYLFGMDPTPGASPEFRILASAKFSHDAPPPSRRFEFTTETVSVRRISGRSRIDTSKGKWIDRGDVTITASAVMLTLVEESKDRQQDRIDFWLLRFLHKGKDRRMQPVTAVREAMKELDPPVSWKAVTRSKDRLGIESIQDPTNKSKRWWSITDDHLDILDAAPSDGDIRIEEIDIPDAPPEDWTS